MKRKKYTQIGLNSILFFLLLMLLLFGLLLITSIPKEVQFAIILIFNIIGLSGIIIFHKLTIIIDENAISFNYGFRLIGKSYKLTDIKTCKPVTNLSIYGIGIRMIPGGMLYNVSGSKAIELRFKDRKSIIRIGTNKPGEICKEIQKFLQTKTA